MGEGYPWSVFNHPSNRMEHRWSTSGDPLVRSCHSMTDVHRAALEVMGFGPRLVTVCQLLQGWLDPVPQPLTARAVVRHAGRADR